MVSSGFAVAVRGPWSGVLWVVPAGTRGARWALSPVRSARVVFGSQAAAARCVRACREVVPVLFPAWSRVALVRVGGGPP